MDRDELNAFTKELSQRLGATGPTGEVARLTPVAMPAPTEMATDLTTHVDRIDVSAGPTRGSPFEHRVVLLALADVLDSPYQPRKRLIGKRDVEDLAALIAAVGQTDPIVVTTAGDDKPGKYFVHSGHRRCVALRSLGHEHVKAIVRSDLAEREAHNRSEVPAAQRERILDGIGRVLTLLGVEQATAIPLDAAASEDLDAPAA